MNSDANKGNVSDEMAFLQTRQVPALTCIEKNLHEMGTIGRELLPRECPRKQGKQNLVRAIKILRAIVNMV